MMKLKKPFNPDVLYNYIVHYYIDKKGVTKEDANKIAQNVISKELQRHYFAFCLGAIFLQVI